MVHPYLFLVKVFEAIGLGHFAHAYPHVIYSWFAMLLLIIFAVLATRKIEMIPTKGQNFFEIVISGMEEFMVDITGEEGRWFFPHCQHQYNRILCNPGVCVYAFYRCQMPRHKIYQAFSRTCLVADPNNFTH